MRTLALVLALSLLPSLAPAAVHQVDQVNLSFQPSDITIQVGDTVTWVQSAGSHTVTSGSGSSDPTVGQLFDAPLNNSSPNFSYVFGAEGTFDYFCRPHEGFNMVGVVRVVAPEPVPTLSQWAMLLLVLLIGGSLLQRRRARA